MRAPRTRWRLFFLLLLSTLSGGGIWLLSERWWMAIPGGLVAGVLITVSLIGIFGSRGGCLPSPERDVDGR